ncbi:MAG: hypothetical protein L0287_31370 [Anaerolineae bacterium]|nr:hypothetical protein [Anaerolineae bacterium]
MKTSIAKIFAGLTREKHTTGAFALDDQNQSVAASDKTAVRWCAAGWLQNRYPLNYDLVIQKINVHIPDRFIAQDNDQLGYAYIKELQMIDEEFELWYLEPDE